MAQLVTFRHWTPIVTFCPVNRLPDLIYVSVTFKDEFQELYAVRKNIRRIAGWRLAFMEDIASSIAAAYPTATKVEVRLAFNRHYIKIEKDA